jgi:hypothetical protein
MKEIDKLTGWVKTISGPHHEVHEGKAYKAVLYNSNIGGETDDQIQLIWTTPGGPAQMNLDIHVYCGAAAAYLFTKGWTGGAASIDGTIIGRNRNHMFPDSDITFSYGATLVTGGTVLEQQTIATTGKFGAGELRDANEQILDVNTKYAISLLLSAAEIAIIQIDWYMKTDRH